jgi:hypothetical protein
MGCRILRFDWVAAPGGRPFGGPVVTPQAVGAKISYTTRCFILDIGMGSRQGSDCVFMIEARSAHSVRNRKRPKNERLRATIQ